MRRPTLAFLALLLAAIPASARDWRVVLDGTGDFTTIQPALAAASAGDTISIATGHYQDYATVDIGGVGTDVYALVETDDLLIRGAGAGQTIIGPDLSGTHDPGTVRAIVGRGIAHLTLETLAVSNVVGIALDVDHYAASVAACRFADCGYGIRGDFANGSDMVGCVFVRGNIGFQASSTDGPLALRSCLFQDCGSGVRLVGAGVTEATVEDAILSGGMHGAMLLQGSQGTFRRCYVHDHTSDAFFVSDTSAAIVVDSHVDEPTASGIVMVGHDARLMATGTVVSSGVTAIALDDCADVSFTAGHVLRTAPDAWSVRAGQGSPTGDDHADLTGNWWGTTDLATISAWILDHADDPDVRLVVDVVPVAGGEVATEPRTWGTVKALFR